MRELKNGNLSSVVRLPFAIAIGAFSALGLGCGQTAIVDPMSGALFVLQASGTTQSLVAVGPGKGLGSNNIYAETGGDPSQRLTFLYSVQGSWSSSTDHAASGDCLTCKTPLTTMAGGVFYMAGPGPNVQHYDTVQKSWVLETTGLGGDVLALWGSDSGVLVAVGDGGGIAIDNNNIWTVAKSPTQKSLRAVWGNGPTSIYAVGDGGTVLHSNGTAWTLEKTPTTAAFHDVWGSASAGVFAVGDGGNIIHKAML